MDMLNRVHYNRSQLKILKDKRSEMRMRFVKEVRRHSDLDFYKDNIPAEVVEKAKQKVRLKLAAQKRRSTVILSVSLVVGVVVLVM